MSKRIRDVFENTRMNNESLVKLIIILFFERRAWTAETLASSGWLINLETPQRNPKE